MTQRMRISTFALAIACSAAFASCDDGVIGGDVIGGATIADDTWYFRGTSNGWATTAMTPIEGTSQHETCQAFSGVSDPRFKVDHHGDWAESYPAQDYQVADDTSYQITFDAATQTIDVQPVTSCGGSAPTDTWYFRGTSNGWEATALDSVEGTSRHETCQTFSGVPSPRFKIDHFGDWTENYPAQDYTVDPTAPPITIVVRRRHQGHRCDRRAFQLRRATRHRATDKWYLAHHVRVAGAHDRR